MTRQQFKSLMKESRDRVKQIDSHVKKVSQNVESTIKKLNMVL
jgi:parvulin-like peptidyl-prolyl isomerase